MLVVKAAHLVTVREQKKNEEVGPEDSMFSKGMLGDLPSLLISSTDEDSCASNNRSLRDTNPKSPQEHSASS